MVVRYFTTTWLCKNSWFLYYWLDSYYDNLELYEKDNYDKINYKKYIEDLNQNIINSKNCN